MSNSRYTNRKVYINKEDLYKKRLDDRGVNHINQYESPQFRYPTANQMSQLDLRSHIWKLGDRYYKLAHKYYGDPSLWWVIAWFNQMPTESHIALGDVLDIPFPLESVLTFFK